MQAARRMIQQVGVAGFSFGDLAIEVGIKAPSIHHHFQTKEDLLAAVAATYRIEFAARAAAIDEPTVGERIEAYGRFFEESAFADELCLCGAVAAEWMAVGAKPRREVEQFFGEQIAWLTEQLKAGVEAGELRSDLDATTTAEAILAALEGSLLLGRVDIGHDLTGSVCALLLALAAPSAPKR